MSARDGAILLVGAGRMGTALLQGWLAGGARAVLVVEPKPSVAVRKLARAGRIVLVPAPDRLPARRVRVCVVAVKPQVLKDAAAALAPVARAGALMISIAAGTRTGTLFAAWGARARIVRAMPNTPGAIGRGITGLFAAPTATAADRKRAAALLGALGETLWVKREGQIDAVTAVSGSGPAYLFLLAEALADAGVAEGLPRVQAERLARVTVAGAGALLAAERVPAAALRAAVTSPGGTTAAALSVLMTVDGLGPLMKRAVHAARLRARELR